MPNIHGPTETDILKELKDHYGIHLFRIPTPMPTFTVNVYFIEKPVPTLIDVPMDSRPCLDALESALNKIDYSIQDIRSIVVTHPHLDHFGSAATIFGMSGAQIWATHDTALWMKNCKQELTEEMQFSMRLLEYAGVPVKLINSSVDQQNLIMRQPMCDAVSSCHIEKGNILNLSSSCFRIEHVPGHTPWCIMLYDEQTGIAFTGDFLLKEIFPSPLIQRPWKVPAGYKSLKMYESSLKRVQQMNLALALPGHGPLVENPSERIDELLSFMKKRAEYILEILKKCPSCTPFDLLKEVLPKIPRQQAYPAVSEILAYMEMLDDGSSKLWMSSMRKFKEYIESILPSTGAVSLPESSS